MTEPGWELYRSFLAVMAEGSLSGAARALGLTQPTVGHHIAGLESALSAALFTRSPRGLTPTDTAQALLPHAQTMAAAADALRRVASGEGDEMRGTVRVTASEVVGAEVLPAILADFREQHRQVVVELSLSNRSEDLLRHQADIAVRMVKPTQGALIARFIGNVVLGLCAHRRYLERHGTPQRIEDILGHALVGPDRDIQSLRGIPGIEDILTADVFSLRVDSHLAHLSALRAGYGISIAQLGLVRRDPELVHLFPKEFAPELPVWLVMHEDLRTSRRVRALYEHLVVALGEYVRVSGIG